MCNPILVTLLKMRPHPVKIPPPPPPPSDGIVVEWKLKKEIYYRVNVFGIISHGVSKNC